jgi:hypothetical protein
MKQIEPISIWDAGLNKQADILNAFATDLQLGKSAEFYYTISNETEQLASGKLTLEGDDYQQWEGDDFAWDWIAEQLNLTITGDYVPPVMKEVTELHAIINDIRHISDISDNVSEIEETTNTTQ